MREALIEGWDWMKRNPDHERLDNFFNETWLPLLSIYEARFQGGGEDLAVKKLLKHEEPLPAPSPWIGELHQALLFDGTADVDPA